MRLDRLRFRGFGPFTETVDLDLSQIEGPVIAIVGKNGEGKTTMLELYGGAIHRDTATRGSLARIANSRSSFVEVYCAAGAQNMVIKQKLDQMNDKGESTVTTGEGVPLMKGVKRPDFDKWVARNLTSEEVFYATEFIAQKSGGFLAADKSGRKKILSRVLGLGQLDLMMDAARARSKAASTELTKIEATIAANLRGDPIALAMALEDAERARDEARRARASAARTSAALRLAVTRASADVLAAEERGRARADLESQIEAAKARAKHVAVLLANNRRLLAEAEPIRAAAQRKAVLISEIRGAEASLVAFQGDIALANQALAAASQRLNDAEQRAAGARARLQRTSAKVGDRKAILDALASCPQLQAAIVTADGRYTEATGKLASVVSIQDQISKIYREAELQASRRDAVEARGKGSRARAAEARARLPRLRAKLEHRQAIAEAKASLPDLRADVAAAQTACTKATTELAQLGALQLDSAQRRSGQLRDGLIEIAGAAGDLVDLANATIAVDDDTIAAVAAAPLRQQTARVAAENELACLDQAREALAAAERLAARQGEIDAAEEAIAAEETAIATEEAAATEAATEGAAVALFLADEEARCRALAAGVEGLPPPTEGTTLYRVGAARQQRRVAAENELACLDQAREALAAAERLAARQGEIDAAEEAIAAEETAIATEEAAIARATQEIAEAAQTAAAEKIRCSAIEDRIARHRAEDASLEQYASFLAPLANAEARIAELLPTEAAETIAVDSLTGRLAELPALGGADGPSLGDVARAEADVLDKQVVLDAAIGAAVRLDEQLETARAAASLVEDMTEQRRQKASVLADAEHILGDLAEMQALEIDAAGPDLSALANLILRTCHGPRWTIDIKTTRERSRGKGEIEDCIVNVYDATKNITIPGEYLSGGEKVIVGEAITDAISVLGCRRSGQVGATLIRDESGDGLDEENGPIFMDMLRHAVKLAKASKVLFVSHRPDVIKMADTVIRVHGGKITVESPTASPGRL